MFHLAVDELTVFALGERCLLSAALFAHSDRVRLCMRKCDVFGLSAVLVVPTMQQFCAAMGLGECLNCCSVL